MRPRLFHGADLMPVVADVDDVDLYGPGLMVAADLQTHLVADAGLFELIQKISTLARSAGARGPRGRGFHGNSVPRPQWAGNNGRRPTVKSKGCLRGVSNAEDKPEAARPKPAAAEPRPPRHAA
jgi:hypothetical protein